METEISKQSLNIVSEKLSELRKVVPESFIEGKIDFDRLKMSLGQFLELGEEKYSFTWAGRQSCFKSIQSPATSTLVPDKPKSVKFESVCQILDLHSEFLYY